MLHSMALVLAIVVGTSENPPLFRSVQSGPWSSASTWEGGKVPTAGNRVQVRGGHVVNYDVASDEVIRSIHVAGTLSFARDRDTRLTVGLIKIQPGNDASENGFDCDAHMAESEVGKARPALEVGTADEPIPTSRRAIIRLAYVEGMDKKTCPGIVCCGGRMDLHGAPLRQTWVKLYESIRVGDARFVLPNSASDWKVGDRIIITATSRRRGYIDLDQNASVAKSQATEERTITGFEDWGGVDHPYQLVTLDRPLQFAHEAIGDFRGEVANLTRNVVIESARPEGQRGHVMYHKKSAGSVSYVEFRHLGKEGVLGKYTLHFHQCGDSMRGSSVVGASFWDSKNRWLTVHGTNYLVVRDCVGYRSVGHGYFLEDGTEVYNVFDHNLGVLALRGKPLPQQVLPYDRNFGSGFWWANSLNTFTRNVAVENDADGFRFEVVKDATFDPVLNVRQPDGSRKAVDVRTLPFVRFDENESHTHKQFGINLGGISRIGKALGEPGADVEGIGPDAQHPFHLRNCKIWDAHWAFHSSPPSVILERIQFHESTYGLWRCVLTGHTHLGLTFSEVDTTLFQPRAIPSEKTLTDLYPEALPVDDLPPSTVVTNMTPISDGRWLIAGTTNDNFVVKQVTVNGRKAHATRGNFSEWEIEVDVPFSQPVTIEARSEDTTGNIEKTPHIVRIDSEASGSPLRAAKARY